MISPSVAVALSVRQPGVVGWLVFCCCFIFLPVTGLLDFIFSTGK